MISSFHQAGQIVPLQEVQVNVSAMVMIAYVEAGGPVSQADTDEVTRATYDYVAHGCMTRSTKGFKS